MPDTTTNRRPLTRKQLRRLSPWALLAICREKVAEDARLAARLRAAAGVAASLADLAMVDALATRAEGEHRLHGQAARVLRATIRGRRRRLERASMSASDCVGVVNRKAVST